MLFRLSHVSLLLLFVMLVFHIVILSEDVNSLELVENSVNNFLVENEANSLPAIISGLDLSSDKIDSYIKQNANSFLNKRIPLIIQTSGKVSVSNREELINLGAIIKYEYNIIDAVALSVDTLQLDKIAELSFVKRVEFDAPTKVVLAQSTTQIGASRVWISHEVEGEGITIAVLDTGIDDDHADVKNVVKEQDFTGEGTDDENGHGTHVASTAAGTGAVSGGANKGVAPKAKLIDVKVLNRLGSGVMSDTIAGIQYAVLNDADIISMSLGADIPCNGLDATSLASDAAVRQGVHVIVAAGNTGPLPGTIGSPGCAINVVTVGAVDRLDNMAVFSSRGPTLDGRTKPDIVAPGVLILAAQTKGTYTAKSGTSMATPHVSGVVALILSQNPGLTPEQLKNVLIDTALDLGQDKNSQGAGRIQAYEAFIEGTGLEPKEKPKNENGESGGGGDSGKEEAKRKARDEENVENVNKVREKQEDGNDYYVVDGYRSEDGDEERVWVYVNQDTGNIDKVTIVGVIKKIWLAIADFFAYLF
jgi:subtilisin family serine protease